MADMGFGLTVTLLGMGGTLLSLWLLSLLVSLLKRCFPYRPEEKRVSSDT